MAENTQQELVTILTKALRKLGEAGEADAASRLGGKAWWVLKRADDDRNAERVNGTMHYLASLPGTSAGKSRSSSEG